MIFVLYISYRKLYFMGASLENQCLSVYLTVNHGQIDCFYVNVMFLWPSTSIHRIKYDKSTDSFKYEALLSRVYRGTVSGRKQGL